MMTNGLYIEIDLNEAPVILKQLESVTRERRTAFAPFFHSLNGSSTPNAWANGSTSAVFYVSEKNSLAGSDAVSKFPFVVGETLNFCRSDNNGSVSTLSAAATISQINLSAAANGSDGLIEITLASGVTNNTGKDLGSEQYVLYSTAVESAASYDASFVVSNVNLIVSQVQLDPGYERGMIQKVREGKAIEFDIMTATNYKHSILASDRQTTFQIFANNSRAKSLLIVPTDASVYNSAQLISASGTYSIVGSGGNSSTQSEKDTQDTSLNSNRSGYTGICDFLSSVQYLVNGKRVPSREISTKKIATRNSIDAFHIYELEKTLDNAEIAPKSFSAFRDNFIFGRGFSAGSQKGAMDLRGKDLAVVLKYQESTAPAKPKLFQAYVFHLRRLMLREGNIDIVF